MLTHTLPYLTVFTAAGLLLGAWLYRRGWAFPNWFAACLIAAYLLVAAWYGTYPNYLDHIEPAVTVVAQQLLYARPAYHPLMAAERYAMVYGPLNYLLLVPLLAWLPDPVLASKLTGLAFALAGGGLFAYTIRRAYGSRLAWWGTAGLALGLAWFGHYAYWCRAESFLLFCACLGVWALSAPRPWWRVLALGVALAVAINIKFYALAYFLPLLLDLALASWKQALAVVALAAVGALLPFILWPSLFPAGDYLALLQAVGGVSFRQMTLNMLAVNTLFHALGLVVLLALIVSRLKERPANRLRQLAPAVMCMAAVLLTILTGGREVAGPYYLIPLLPVIIYYTLTLLPSGASIRPVAYAAFGIALVIALAGQALIVTRMALAYSSDAARRADLQSVQQKYAATNIQLGLGGDDGYASLFLRPWFYATGRPALLDPIALMELQDAGLELSPKTQAVITGEVYDIWLIPRPGPPFSMLTWYQPDRPIFPEQFRQAFEAHYQKVDTSATFEVWQARRLAH